METNRTCGSCSYCCTHVKVDAFNKPAGISCSHLLPVINDCGACGIYEDRPSECRQYKCSWLEGRLPEELKPDKSGLLFETGWIEWPKKLFMVMGFEHVAGAIDRFEKQLDAAAKNGTVIVVIPKDGSEGVMFAEKEDGETYFAFMDMCRRAGGITHVFADGVVEDKFEPEPKGEVDVAPDRVRETGQIVDTSGAVER